MPNAGVAFTFHPFFNRTTCGHITTVAIADYYCWCQTPLTVYVFYYMNIISWMS